MNKNQTTSPQLSPQFSSKLDEIDRRLQRVESRSNLTKEHRVQSIKALRNKLEDKMEHLLDKYNQTQKRLTRIQKKMEDLLEKYDRKLASFDELDQANDLTRSANQLDHGLDSLLDVSFHKGRNNSSNQEDNATQQPETKIPPFDFEEDIDTQQEEREKEKLLEREKEARELAQKAEEEEKKRAAAEELLRQLELRKEQEAREREEKEREAAAEADRKRKETEDLERQQREAEEQQRKINFDKRQQQIREEEEARNNERKRQLELQEQKRRYLLQQQQQQQQEQFRKKQNPYINLSPEAIQLNQQLKEMGYIDENKNFELLRKHNNRIDGVIEELLG